MLLAQHSSQSLGLVPLHHLRQSEPQLQGSTLDVSNQITHSLSMKECPFACCQFMYLSCS